MNHIFKFFNTLYSSILSKKLFKRFNYSIHFTCDFIRNLNLLDNLPHKERAIKDSQFEMELIKRGLSFIRKHNQPRSESFFFKFFHSNYSDKIRLPASEDHPVSSYDITNTHISNVSKYNTFKKWNIDIVKYTKCMYYVVFELLSIPIDGKFKTLDHEEAITHAEKNTNSGFPLFIKKNTEECRSYTLNECFNLVSKLNKSSFKNFSFISKYVKQFFIPPFTRVQLSATDTLNNQSFISSKIRTVWPVPYIINLFEVKLFFNIIEHLKNLELSNKVYLFGNKQRDIGHRVNQIRSKCDLNSNILCLDFSQFDASVNNISILIFFSIFEKLLSYKCHTPRWLYKLVTNFHLETILLSPDKNFYHKQSGLLSGSYLTNFMGSVINLTNLVYLHEVNDLPYPTKDSVLCQGDDIFFLKPISLPDFYWTDMYKQIGYKINETKSIEIWPDQNISFLGRYWSYSHNDPLLDIESAALKLIFPESSALKMEGHFRIIYRAMSILLTRDGGKDIFNSIFNKDRYLEQLLLDDTVEFVYLGSDPELQILLKGITVQQFIDHALEFC